MIAKIGRGSNMTGAISYNWQKVSAGKATVLFVQNMVDTPDGRYTMARLCRSFAPYLIANKRTEKPVLHISLNPDPGDKVTDEKLKQIAEEYMAKMGYGNQPFVVFKHTDTARTHIHVVSTCVDRFGKKIGDSYEKRRSMDICRGLEQKHDLIPATEKQQNGQQELFQPVNYTLPDIKSQVASVVRYLPKYYRFSGIGAYNALLSLFNITAEEVKGELRGQAKHGLVYFALNEQGIKASKPFKASLFGKQAGREALEIHFESGKEKLRDNPAKAVLRNAVASSLHLSAGETEFKKNMIDQGISTVVRRTDQGRIYGITFIDHESRTVWNGSQLGKDLSANVFNGRWTRESPITTGDAQPVTGPLPYADRASIVLSKQEEVHGLFNFLSAEPAPQSIAEPDLIEGLGSLLPQAQGEDYEELAFAHRMKKKRKRKRP